MATRHNDEPPSNLSTAVIVPSCRDQRAPIFDELTVALVPDSKG